MSRFDQFVEDTDESHPYAHDRKKKTAHGPRSDLFGIFGILFAVVGWAVICLGLPLLAALGAGILVMLAGSGICLVRLVPSLLSSTPARRMIALVLNGIGSIPAAFIVFAKILNYLFPV